LTDDDFRAIRTATDDFFGRRTIILFDGSCGLCRRSMAVLKSFDFLHRLTFVNFHDAALRTTHAPKIPMSELDAALHIKRADGSFAKGFYAFRSLCWQLPPLWILAPFLYIPGISWIGEVVYSWVAGRREKCTSSHCTL
jgi:predicted DCC family thiol-disulfide oxidoreductase YuxK